MDEPSRIDKDRGGNRGELTSALWLPPAALCAVRSADHRTHTRAMSVPPSPGPTRSSLLSKAKKKQQASNGKGHSSGGRGERESFADSPRPPSPAHIEEIGSDEDSDDAAVAAASGPQQRRVPKRVATLPTKAGSASSSAPVAPLSAMQRKAMQKANKNSVKGLGGKTKAATGGVEVEDELINEEDEGGDHSLGLSDDEDAASASDSEGVGSADDDEIIWESSAAIKAKKAAAAAAAAEAAANPGSRFPSLCSLLVYLLIALTLGGLVWIRLQDASLFSTVDPHDLDSSAPPDAGEDFYSVLEVPRDAQLKDIRAAYRRLVLVTHPVRKQTQTQCGATVELELAPRDQCSLLLSAPCLSLASPFVCCCLLSVLFPQDKNRDCADCAAKFQKVQKAYDTLSNSDKRSMYDSIEQSFDLLQSDAVELTSANFADQVLHKDQVWVIEVYTDWHKSAIRFSQAWEESIALYGGLVKFGRIHAHRERELARSLPVKFNVIPSVVVYANGGFAPHSKSFLESSHKALSKLAHFIAENYPNTVEGVENSRKGIKEFMERKNAAEDEEQGAMLLFPDFAKQAAAARKLPKQQSGGGSQGARFQAALLASQAQKINDPSLTYKSLSRRFQYAFRFGQVSQLQDPSGWRHWIQNVSTSFNLKPPTSLPALLYREDADSAPKWLMGELKKEKLLRHMESLHRRAVPWMNSHSYARHCTEGSTARDPIYCVLALACAPLRIGDLEFNSFASGARLLQKSPAFRATLLQFAKVDATPKRSPDMHPLCGALPESARQADTLQIVVTADNGAEMFHYGSEQMQDHVQFEEWLGRVVKREGKVKVRCLFFVFCCAFACCEAECKRSARGKSNLPALRSLSAFLCLVCVSVVASPSPRLGCPWCTFLRTCCR